MRILYVEDEKFLADAVIHVLDKNGIAVEWVADGEEGLELALKPIYDAIVLDVMLPKMSGFDILCRVREKGVKTPIIMLSAKSEDYDKITGLNVGADDYITKPFNPLELVARVKSQLRRYTSLGSLDNEEGNDVYVSGGLIVDDTTKTIMVDGEQVTVTPTEFGILKLLTQNAGKVFSIDEIYEKVWKEPAFNPENTVAVHVRRIREKIEINPKNPKYLKVVWGIGYKVEKY